MGTDRVVVHTDKDSYAASRLIITAGAWAGKVAPQVARHAQPERQVLGWFAPIRPELFRPATFPVFGVEVAEGRFYGFPSYGVPGFKLGMFNHFREQVDPGHHGPGAQCPRRSGAPRLHRAVLSGCCRPHPGPENLHLYQHARRAFHNRHAARLSASLHRRRVLGSRVQVLQRGGRNHGRSGPARGQRNTTSACSNWAGSTSGNPPPNGNGHTRQEQFP